MAYTPDPNNTSEPVLGRPAGTAAEEFRLIKAKIASIIAGMVVTTAAGANAADLHTYFQPDINDRPAITAAGWLPWNLNHQWGGAPMPYHVVDAATGTEYKFDAADSYIDRNGLFAFGDAAGTYYRYQVITPSKNLTLNALWIPLYKQANPVDNVTVKLWSVAAGVPNAVIATANTINGKQISSDTRLNFYRFTFAAPPALVAGTQYIFSLEKSGGVDAVNYYVVPAMNSATAATRYPSNLSGFGTAVPAWTAANTSSLNFLVEAAAADQVVQSAGQFNGRLVGLEGNPINRSVGFIRPLREFFPLFHQNGWSILLRGKSWTKDRTIADIMWGLHHDRINIRAATATGFPVVTVYESDNTVTTVTGTSDISTNTFKDLLIVGRSLNDGADYIKIYTGVAGVWTKEAESLGLSLVFDPLMRQQGHMWLLGGFKLYANTDYTKLSEMGVLPSADGWTFSTTTATAEGNVFAVNGGKLNQIASGMAAGGDGRYIKTAAGFNSANGGSVTAKLYAPYGSGIRKANASAAITIGFWDNGLRAFFVNPTPAHDQIRSNAGALSHDTQADNKIFSTYLLCGKGNDQLTFKNGKLISDGTSFNTDAVAADQVLWGDNDTTANENADVVWDYVGYTTVGPILPQFTSGELHEFGVWSGDKNLLGQALYNLGAALSIKQYCGVNRNFHREQVTKSYLQHGITAAPSTATVSDVVCTDMEVFCIGKEFDARFSGIANNNTANMVTQSFIYVDGRQINYTINHMQQIAAGGALVGSLNNETKEPFLYYGLHKVDLRYNAVLGGTSSFSDTRRQLVVNSRAYD